jgi:hypothetical protein
VAEVSAVVEVPAFAAAPTAVDVSSASADSNILVFLLLLVPALDGIPAFIGTSY